MKWDEEFLTMMKEKSEFISIPWFDSLVSVSEKMESMISATFRLFDYPPCIINNFRDLKQNTLAAQHFANIESKWNHISDILNSLYNRFRIVFGGDSMNLMRKIRNINEKPTPEQTERLNGLFKVFDSLPISFGYLVLDYDFNMYPIYHAINNITCARSAEEISFNLRLFEKACDKIDQLSIRDIPLTFS